MEKKFSTAVMLKEIRRSELFRNAAFPLGYTAGLPLLSIRNGYLCMLIPYLKYKITGHKDKTLVFPVRYVIEVLLPEQRIVKIEDLAYNPIFGKVEFNRAIGLFRHEAIQNLDKEAYAKKRHELLAEYDKVIAALTEGAPYTADDEQRMRQLMQLLLEPSLRPFYKVFDKDFYNKYIAHE